VVSELDILARLYEARGVMENMSRAGRPTDGKVYGLAVVSTVLLQIVQEAQKSLSHEEQAVVADLLGEVEPVLDAAQAL
jgi:hypothetical protein